MTTTTSEIVYLRAIRGDAAELGRRQDAVEATLVADHLRWPTDLSAFLRWRLAATMLLSMIAGAGAAAWVAEMILAARLP